MMIRKNGRITVVPIDEASGIRGALAGVDYTTRIRSIGPIIGKFFPEYTSIFERNAYPNPLSPLSAHFYEHLPKFETLALLPNQEVFAAGVFALGDENDSQADIGDQDEVDAIKSLLVSAHIITAQTSTIYSGGFSYASFLTSVPHRGDWNGVISKENIAFRRVADALLFQREITDHDAKTFTHYFGGNISIPVFNPTGERLQDAATCLRGYSNFLEANARQVSDAVVCLFYASLMRSYANSDGRASVHSSNILEDCVGKMITELETQAKEIVAALSPPDTGLQRFVY